MRELIVLTALAIVFATYVWFSRKDGSWFNALTPQLFLAIPSLYLAQIARLSLDLDEPATILEWAYLFACYCVPVVVFAWTLQYAKVPHLLRIRHRKLQRLQSAPWVCLVLGILLYLPVAIAFRADLLNPRAIYEQTRSGFGVNFFLSTMLATLGFVLYLFKTRSELRRAVFYLICTGLSLAHGSKSAVLFLGMIWLLHRRYADGHRLPLKQALPLLLLMAAALAGLFYFFSTGIEIADLANYIIGYSDYTSNGLMVMHADKPALFGRLFFEDNVYSRVPRVLFPGKPKDFGTFYLAKLYFPESFELDQGVPAFGVGLTYADFKWLTLPILCAGAVFMGMLTKTYRNALARFRQPGDFVVFLFLCGAPVLSVGAGVLLPEHMIIGSALTLLLGLRLRRQRTALGRPVALPVPASGPTLAGGLDA